MYVGLPQRDPLHNTLIPVLMHLLVLRWPPLAAHQLLFVFVAIALLSTSIHLRLPSHDVNPKWLIKDKSGPQSNTQGVWFAYISHDTSLMSR